MIYDIAIIGLGAMGSSSLYHASTEYKNILAIEQFSLNHTNGSSHGETRIIREAYYEGEFYVPMAQKSLELFKKLQEESQTELYKKAGCLIIGRETSKLYVQSKESAIKHKIDFKIYKTNKELQQRVPGFFLPEGFIALYDETAGILYPEKCIKAHIEMAQKKNKDIQLLWETKCLGFEQKNENIEVVTNKGTFVTKKIILTTGKWVNDFHQNEKLQIKIQQNTVNWFHNDNILFTPQYFPTFLVEYDEDLYFYGFPDMFSTGVKVGYHLQGKICQSPDEIQNNQNGINKQIVERLQYDVKNFLPNITNSQCIKQSNCYYSLTPDSHFIIDFYKQNKNIVVLSPCSGHGFKFSSLIGQMACELLRKKVNEYSMFKINRFQQQTPKL